MSRLAEWHQQVNELGEGKCSVPMWCNGMDAGFCDRPAYGERPPAGKVIRRFDGSDYRLDGLYAGYVPGLACSIHGGPSVRTFMDGDAWCAVGPDFINLQESHAGFGPAREAAIAALRLNQGTNP